MALREYFQQPYQGGESFINEVIIPIFGEDQYDDAYEEDILMDNPEYVPMAEATGISQIIRLGTIDIPMNPTDVFDITVSNHVQMERNRVAIQLLVRRIMNTYSSAFMVFHYDDDEKWDWRFTFCSKQGNNSDTTSSKRYTFLLGPNQSCRTATENFTALLNKHGNIELADIIRAFDVEALSKEFFAKYKEQYEKFCNYIYQNKNNRSLFGVEFSIWEEKKIRDYVKKMLGRIVFLHFLQKKGWMGVPTDKDWGEGDKQFMKNLFDNASDQQKANYLDDVLEPLFEKALDTDRTDNDDLFDCGVEGYRNVKVPYLNGGLFESDEMDTPKSVFPASMFDDLLSFLYQYNFTIDENDPDDAEVGVDPEMLGRIFENLLEDNKDKGAFYTPKEIVQYMCKESLIAYLLSKFNGNEDSNKMVRDFVETHDTEPLEGFVLQWDDNRDHDEQMVDFFDRHLKDVKICDPAIGSGAFPMGLLKEIFFCRMAIEKFNNAAEIKKHIIQQNIYGVDIEKGAVDIARLRFWLCLIIDEETPHALPNLDFKIMQGNSLLEQYKGVDLSDVYNPSRRQLSLAFDDESAARTLLQVNIADYYKTDNHAERSVLLNKINNAVRELVKAKTWKNRAISNEIEAFDFKNNQDFFLWHTWFSDVFETGGFDIVIGNPPYIQLQNDNGFLSKQYQDKNFETFDSTGDIYSLFYEVGVSILRKNGTLAYITSNKWMKNNSGERTRNFFSTRTNPLLLIDFAGMQLFDTATVETNILILSKEKNKYCTHTVIADEKDNRPLSALDKYVNDNGSLMSFRTKEPWIILNPREVTINNKVAKLAKPIKDWNVAINFGVKTGYNTAFIIDTSERNRIIRDCKDDTERVLTESIIMPVLRGRDIKRYVYNWQNLWVINTHNGLKGTLAPVAIENVPAIKAHLDRHKNKLIQRSDKGITPYNLRNCAYLQEFYKPKIIWGEISDRSKFCFDEKGEFFCEATTFFMTGEISTYLLCYLNSKLAEYLFSKIATTTGMGTVRWKKYKIEQLLVPCVSIEKELEIDSLYRKYISSSDESYLREIDILIYKHFGLTDEEIEIIEDNTKR